jgi:hypothetical protein
MKTNLNEAAGRYKLYHGHIKKNQKKWKMKSDGK